MRFNVCKKRGLCLASILFVLGGLIPRNITNAGNLDSPPDVYYLVDGERYWSFNGTDGIVFAVGNSDDYTHHVWTRCLNNDEEIETWLGPSEMVSKTYWSNSQPWKFEVDCTGGKVIILAAWAIW